MEKQYKYIGSWHVNNGSTYSIGHKSNNKNKLAKEMKEAAKANVFVGNRGQWYVYPLTENGPAESPILTGKVKK